jgi:nickel-dependent lactate racemase
MRITLPYGRDRMEIDVDARQGQVAVLEPRRDAVDPIRLAMAAPIGSPPLRELVHPGQSIVIVTSDITRPCPTQKMLPPVMDELGRAGIPDRDVTVVFGMGTHRPHTPEERVGLVGPEMARRLRCIDSDPGQTVCVGTTRRGTPVEVFEPVVKAGLRIALGNVEPHYFAGYSGGLKAIVPGVCSANTIRHNHALMIEPNARTGVLDGNPVREDLEEGASLVGVDFLLNVLLDSAHQVAVASSGHPVEAHRWLCRAADFLSRTPVDRPADIVLVSAGGYPKDINMYQAQKALDNAAEAVRPGGIIVWVAECIEGLGNATFEKWMVGSSADDILSRIKSEFVLGGHKAAAIARVLKRATVLLVSALPPELVRACGMQPCPDIESALQTALRQVGREPLIYVMPEGAAVVPSLAVA